MPTLIAAPTRIAAAGNQRKLIEGECVNFSLVIVPEQARLGAFAAESASSMETCHGVAEVTRFRVGKFHFLTELFRVRQ